MASNKNYNDFLLETAQLPRSMLTYEIAGRKIKTAETVKQLREQLARILFYEITEPNVSFIPPCTIPCDLDSCDKPLKIWKKEFDVSPKTDTLAECIKIRLSFLECRLVRFQPTDKNLQKYLKLIQTNIEDFIKLINNSTTVAGLPRKNLKIFL